MAEPDLKKLECAVTVLGELLRRHAIETRAPINCYFNCGEEVILGLPWTPQEIARWAGLIPDEIEGVPIRFVQILRANMLVPSQCVNVSEDAVAAHFRRMHGD